MSFLFPGMDPYLEHLALWEEFQARLLPGLANQLQPQLDPRYIARLEKDQAQGRVEILDGCTELKLVTSIEVLSPANKQPGPGKESYLVRQRETLNRECHLIEIDLHRHGEHVLSVPEWRLRELRPFDYLTCVSRLPTRHRFHLYPTRLRKRLPVVLVPLAKGDLGVALDIQDIVEQAYREARYGRRIRYDEPCVPPLSVEDQEWVRDLLRKRALVFE